MGKIGFLEELPNSKLREFFEENLQEYQAFNVCGIGSCRTVRYWEKDARQKVIYEMTFLDDAVIPSDDTVLEKWKNFMLNIFGDSYKDQYMK